MPFSLSTAFVSAAICFTGLAAALPAPATTSGSPHVNPLPQLRHKMVPAPFNETAYSAFVDCVRGVSPTKYEIAIDEGVVAVVPFDNSTSIDIEGADSALHDCTKEAYLHLHVGIDLTRYAVHNGAEFKPLDEATAAWAESHGASGIKLIPAPTNSTSAAFTPSPSQMLKRDFKNYYGAYLSDLGALCHLGDFKISYHGNCYSYMSSFSDVGFANYNCDSLTVVIYPHHDCGKNYSNPNGRVVTVAPLADSACISRTTYSYYATFQLAC